MSDFSSPISGSEQVIAALDVMASGLDRLSAGIATLRQLLDQPVINSVELDPKNPANKFEVGGLEKLTPRGVEVCYRLFDQGKARYGVAQAMGISFGAATHRYAAWLKAGGLNRQKQPLE